MKKSQKISCFSSMCKTSGRIRIWIGMNMGSRILISIERNDGSEFFPSRIRIFHPGTRIRIQEFKYFNPKKWFLSSRILILISGSRGQKGTGSRIRNTACKSACFESRKGHNYEGHLHPKPEVPGLTSPGWESNRGLPCGRRTL